MKRRLWMPILMILVLISNIVYAQTYPEATLKIQWTHLVEDQCDLALHHVMTPVEASALRNTPYALQGYTFKTEALTRLFKADGGWYVPRRTAKMKFSSEEAQCIKKLKDHEARMKQEIPITKSLKTKILAQHTLVIQLRRQTFALMNSQPTVSVTKNRLTLTNQCREAQCVQEAPSIVEISCRTKKCKLF